MKAGLPADRVLAALDEVLGWPAIARSPQLADFLDYIVRKTLAGEEAGIKAYSIAVDVFGRPTTFDPQSDPIVRVQARRLRALLDQFYTEHPQTASGVRIDLPTGRYVPDFVPHVPAIVDEPPAGEGTDQPAAPAGAVAAAIPEAAAPEAAAPPEGGAAPATTTPVVGRWGLAALVAIAAVVFGLALFVSLNRQADPPVEQPAASASATVPGRPVIAVGSFADLSGDGDLTALGEDLAARVAALLSRFDDFEILTIDSDRTDDVGASAYMVGGIVSPGTPGPEVTSLVSSGPDTLWTLESRFDSAVPGPGAIEDMARRIVAEIAPLRGPIYDRARAWLDEQQRPLPAVSPFVCLLTYRLARESGSSAHLSDALVCHERLLDAEPDNAVAIASRAVLEMRARLNQMRPGDDVRTVLAAPLAEAQRARSLAPDSSFVAGALGLIHNWRNEFADSRRAFTDALELNPMNTDARGGYAIALARGVDWTLGVEQAARAIADSPRPPSWYFYPAAMNAWRAGRLEDALDFALRASEYGAGEAGTLIALAAAAMLGRETVADELRPRVLALERLRLWGIRPWLRAQVMEGEVADSVAEGLRRAGITEDALTGPF